MQDEKMMILEMVKEGKITPDDAVKLLQALGAKADTDAGDVEEKLNTFYQNVECFAKDCNEKVSAFAKDVEPKLKEATKVLVEKITPLLDNLSTSLKESVKPDDNETAAHCEKADCCCEKCADDNEPKPNA